MSVELSRLRQYTQPPKPTRRAVISSGGKKSENSVDTRTQSEPDRSLTSDTGPLTSDTGQSTEELCHSHLLTCDAVDQQGAWMLNTSVRNRYSVTFGSIVHTNEPRLGKKNSVMMRLGDESPLPPCRRKQSVKLAQGRLSALTQTISSVPQSHAPPPELTALQTKGLIRQAEYT